MAVFYQTLSRKAGTTASKISQIRIKSKPRELISFGSPPPAPAPPLAPHDTCQYNEYFTVPDLGLGQVVLSLILTHDDPRRITARDGPRSLGLSKNYPRVPSLLYYPLNRDWQRCPQKQRLIQRVPSPTQCIGAYITNSNPHFVN